MPRKVDLPHTRRHVQIYDEDWDFISETYGQGGLKPIGISEAIRKIIHSKVLSLKAKLSQVEDQEAEERIQ